MYSAITSSVTFPETEAAGGSNYVQCLNPGNATATAVVVADESTTCTYSGTGFVKNPAFQPSACNVRVFPASINGVRQMGMNGANTTVSRNFHLVEWTTLETCIMAYNVFNHQILVVSIQPHRSELWTCVRGWLAKLL
jgi:hypothetical protein